jgi:hypothetical protein
MSIRRRSLKAAISLAALAAVMLSAVVIPAGTAPACSPLRRAAAAACAKPDSCCCGKGDSRRTCLCDQQEPSPAVPVAPTEEEGRSGKSPAVSDTNVTFVGDSGAVAAAWSHFAPAISPSVERTAQAVLCTWRI